MRRPLTIPMFMQVGQRRYQIESFEQASQMFCTARDKSGLGASQMPADPTIVDQQGNVVAYVSYNGRVWPGDKYVADAKPLYDNR